MTVWSTHLILQWTSFFFFLYIRIRGLKVLKNSKLRSHYQEYKDDKKLKILVIVFYLFTLLKIRTSIRNGLRKIYMKRFFEFTIFLQKYSVLDSKANKIWSPFSSFREIERYREKRVRDRLYIRKEKQNFKWFVCVT